MKAIIHRPPPVPTEATISLHDLTVEELGHIVRCCGSHQGPTGLYDRMINAWQQASGLGHNDYPKEY
jgi:hypothetical protein